MSLDPMWNSEIYEPMYDEHGAPVVLSPAEYFGDPDHVVNHPHPQGWPCHYNCHPRSGPEEPR